MTKKELLDLISEYPDNAEIVVEVHDTTLHEDLYDFSLDPISWKRFDFDSNTEEQMHEIRICPIKNNK